MLLRGQPVCQRCRKSIGVDCACRIPLLPPGTLTCILKVSYTSRLAAESGLATRRAQWRRHPERAAKPPTRVYRCPACDAYHLTSEPEPRPWPEGAV